MKNFSVVHLKKKERENSVIIFESTVRIALAVLHVQI
jgi:hypothetical protein